MKSDFKIVISRLVMAIFIILGALKDHVKNMTKTDEKNLLVKSVQISLGKPNTRICFCERPLPLALCLNISVTF